MAISTDFFLAVLVKTSSASLRALETGIQCWYAGSGEIVHPCLDSVDSPPGLSNGLFPPSYAFSIARQ